MIRSAGAPWALRPRLAPASDSRRARSCRATKRSTGGYVVDAGCRGLGRAPRRGRRDDAGHPEIHHELAMVIAKLVERTQPVREAGKHPVAEWKLHLLEQLGIRERRDRLLSRLKG